MKSKTYFDWLMVGMLLSALITFFSYDLLPNTIILYQVIIGSISVIIITSVLMKFIYHIHDFHYGIARRPNYLLLNLGASTSFLLISFINNFLPLL